MTIAVKLIDVDDAEYELTDIVPVKTEVGQVVRARLNADQIELDGPEFTKLLNGHAATFRVACSEGWYTWEMCRKEAKHVS